jgi:hypothetical protein
MKDTRAGDSLLISSHDEGFTAILLRAGEPFTVRTVVCDPASATDELYRLLLFYRDRVAAPRPTDDPETPTVEDAGAADMSAGERSVGRTIERVMLIGGVLDEAGGYDLICDTLGTAPRLLRPEDVSLDLPAADLPFDLIAAPAGLAALA